MKCMIVDDEPLAIRVLEKHLEQIPDIEVSATCTSALEAFDRLHKLDVDVLFLDIQMPGLTGTDLVRSLESPPPVVFTTAYRDHAVEGFELDAVDYLLKPVSLPRLLKAIEKVRRFQMQDGAVATGKTSSEGRASPTINVRADREVVKVAVAGIQYVESLGDYVTIHSSEGRVTTKMTISQLEEQLTPAGFIRIHRSYLVRTDSVTAYTSDHVSIGKKELPIGRTYRRGVLEALG